MLNPATMNHLAEDTIVPQFQSTFNGTKFITQIKVYPQGLMINLEKIKKYYEIIIYTYLPRHTMNEIYRHIPQLQDLISHTLTYEDLVYNEESEDYYKDLSLLHNNRMGEIVGED